jgi:hypothetical protein
LEGLVKTRPGVRLLKIDIATWSSAVSNQFGIRRLPTVWLYEGKERVADGPSQVMQLLQEE